MASLPTTTLYMLESLDGKISSGDSDILDVDKDWKNIDGVKEGLHQYYEIEKTTDLFSLNTGRVMAKIGVNTTKEEPHKIPCTFVIIDNKPHINAKGIEYMTKWLTKLIIVTTNTNHPAFMLKPKYGNLDILLYDELDLKLLLKDIKETYHVDRITIQSGGNMNARFIREGLIDYIHVIIAPLIVGGNRTSTLVDGESIKKVEELYKLKPLQLESCKKLEDSYVELIYKVIK